jgi:hypothetical protein
MILLQAGIESKPTIKLMALIHMKKGHFSITKQAGFNH